MAEVPKAVGVERCRGCGADRITVVCHGCGGDLSVPAKPFNNAHLLEISRRIRISYFAGDREDDLEEAVSDLAGLLEEIDGNPNV